MPKRKTIKSSKPRPKASKGSARSRKPSPKASKGSARSSTGSARKAAAHRARDQFRRQAARRRRR